MPERTPWGRTEWVSPVTKEQMTEAEEIVSETNTKRATQGLVELAIEPTLEEIEAERIRRTLGR